MQSFIKIGGHVFDLWGEEKQRDIHLLLLGYEKYLNEDLILTKCEILKFFC